MPLRVAFLVIALTFALPLSAAKKPLSGKSAKASSPLLKRIDVSSTTSLSLPIAGDKDNKLKECAGVAISARDADARLYGYTDKMSLTAGDSFFSALHFPVWGVGVKFQGLLDIPLTVQAGTLGTGGSLSRLRNPELGNPSLFGNTFSLPKGVETSLPTLSSSKKPIAVSAMAETQTGILTTRVCAAADEDGMGSASLSLKARMPRMMKTGVCVTGGFFPIEDKKAHTSSPQWYSYTPYFADCSIASGSFQTYFDSPLATCILTGNIYQQPERDAALTGRAEAAFHGDVFSCRTGLFVIDKSLAVNTAGTKNAKNVSPTIKETFQLMAQPAVTLHPFSDKRAELTFGASGFLQRYDDETSKGSLNEYTTMKAATGAKFHNRRITAQTTFTAKNIPITGESRDSDTKDVSCQIAAQGSIATVNKIKHSARASFDFEPDTEFKKIKGCYTITVPGKIVRLESNAGLENNHTKTGNNTLTATASVKATITQKPWRITLKAELESVVSASD